MSFNSLGKDGVHTILLLAFFLLITLGLKRSVHPEANLKSYWLIFF